MRKEGEGIAMTMLLRLLKNRGSLLLSCLLNRNSRSPHHHHRRDVLTKQRLVMRLNPGDPSNLSIPAAS